MYAMIVRTVCKSLGRLCIVMLGCYSFPILAVEGDQHRSLDQSIESIESKVIAWRRDIHQHPELSNREFRTAKLVAEHLRSLKFDEVHTGVAHTGVVGVLSGNLPGPVVALRADMDALPVKEMLDLPFASKVTAEYQGKQVPVMHACGHDAHTAILMGVAEVLAGMRNTLPGTVKFIFQPAEEGPPEGEEGGAALMIKQGVLEGAAKPEAIFALHVVPLTLGRVGYRIKGAAAASDNFVIRVIGQQTHGSSPWQGVDPILVAAQIVTAIQAIPSRQLDVTRGPAVITVGTFHGGVRHNIIPEEVALSGTIRYFDAQFQEQIKSRLTNTAKHIAEASGAQARVEIKSGYPVVYNDPQLTQRMIPVLEEALGKDRVFEMPVVMASEDFSRYQEKIPGLFLTLGVNKPGVKHAAATNHSPHFYVNEDALVVGVKALAALALSYLSMGRTD